jgi:hypothetical protein
MTGWVLWGTRLAPRWGHVDLFDIVVRSASYALAACAAGATITLLLYFSARQWQPEEVLSATLRTSRAAIWFAPALILITALSPAAVAAAAVLVISATRLMYHEWRSTNPPAPSLPTPAVLFASIQFPPEHFWRQAAPALLVSFSVQSGVAALLLKKPLVASLWLVLSLAMATVYVVSGRTRHRPPESLPRSFMGLLLILVLAIGLTVGGMLPTLHGNGGGWGFSFGGGNSDIETKVNKPSSRPVDETGLPKFTPTALADDGFPGVVLWPEIKPYATLIAPMPQRADGLGTVDIRPLSIPFSGEYWMFRWPYARPPSTSFFQRGSPDHMSFKTTDHRSMLMEAHHKLEQAVALNCCSRIDLAMRNADRFPGTIVIELELIDNERPGEPSVSLGKELVASQPDVRNDPIRPVPETLSFRIPASAPISKFNEFKITFHRDRRRMDQSAKVAIDRFILVP